MFFLIRSLAAGCALAVLAAAPAYAHVRVFADSDTSRIQPCGFRKFVVRVPTEKAIATTGLRVVIPAGVTAIATQPKPGWRAEFQTEKGRVTAIVWSGGKIMPHEFDEFAFLAATPRRAGNVDWDAYQTYEDNSVVAWAGAPGGETPHSQTVFTNDLSACRGR